MTYDIWRTRYQTEATSQKAPAKRDSINGKSQTTRAGDKEMDLTPTQGADQLRQYIERIERLEEEKRALMADVRDVYSEAKHSGFDPKTMRRSSKSERWIQNYWPNRILCDNLPQALGLG